MLRFVGDGDQKKFTRNPRHFSRQNSQANTKKIHKILLESRQSKGFARQPPHFTAYFWGHTFLLASVGSRVGATTIGHFSSISLSLDRVTVTLCDGFPLARIRICSMLT